MIWCKKKKNDGQFSSSVGTYREFCASRHGLGLRCQRPFLIDDNYCAVKNDFIKALRIIYREGLSNVFTHLSLRSNQSDEMIFVPCKTVE